MKLEIKAYRPDRNIGPEGGAFSASLYADGKRIAIVSNSGWGGPNRYDAIDRERFAEVDAKVDAMHLTYIEQWGKDKGQEVEVDFDKLDWVLSEMIESADALKWFKTKCRNATLFLLNGEDETGGWHTVRSKWCPEVEQWLARKYGDKISEIANVTRLNPAAKFI